jgi:5-methylcytosine-specific restriction endonuclease McrA
MGYRTYAAYLKSARWQRRRAKFRKAHDPACAVCRSTRALQLHHTTYVRLGDERDADLRWLCDLCHSTLHTMDNLGLDPAALFSAERAAANRATRPAVEPLQRRATVDWREECRSLPRRA